MTKESEVSEDMTFEQWWFQNCPGWEDGRAEYHLAKFAWHARDAVIAQLHEDARRVADAVNLELNDLRSKWYTAERKLAKRDAEIAQLKEGLAWFAECVIRERGGTPDPEGWIRKAWGMADARQVQVQAEIAAARRAAIEECATLADSFSGVAMLAQEIRKLASPENQFTCTACHKTFASTPEDAEIGHFCIAADRGLTQREAIEEIKRKYVLYGWLPQRRTE